MSVQWLTLTTPEKVLLGVYFSLWAIFGLIGVRRAWILYLYSRQSRRRPLAFEAFAEPPLVTVQLPIYNERYVVERLIRSVAALDYPRDRLEIQVLDDSTDETVLLVAAEVERLRAEGVRIEHVRRADRTGYKAGALENGMRTAHGEFLLLFDADFVPGPGLLREILPPLVDRRVGMVQARWEHLNAESTLLARVQSISLDGHFVVEHEARAKNDLFFNFNGTAGIWRKSCIRDAGGWEHDTLTEDLDLSYRAQLKGWRFVYLRDVVCPAELPPDMNAFKTQQFRWAKGSAEVAKKILPRVWRSAMPIGKKLDMTVHLTQNAAFVFALLLSLFVLPVFVLRSSGTFRTAGLVELPLFLFATGSLLVFYGIAQVGAGRGWKTQMKYFPAVLSIAIGLSISNTHAILEGLAGRRTPFHRTPKYNVTGREMPRPRAMYQALPSGTSLLEILLGLAFCVVLTLAILRGRFGDAPFVMLFLFGYLYVGWKSLDARPIRLRRS